MAREISGLCVCASRTIQVVPINILRYQGIHKTFERPARTRGRADRRRGEVDRLHGAVANPPGVTCFPHPRGELGKRGREVRTRSAYDDQLELSYDRLGLAPGRD